MLFRSLPILEIDGKILGQSVTIARYLARKYDLTGESEFEAAKCDEYVDALMDSRAGKTSGIWNWPEFLLKYVTEQLSGDNLYHS